MSLLMFAASEPIRAEAIANAARTAGSFSAALKSAATASISAWSWARVGATVHSSGLAGAGAGSGAAGGVGAGAGAGAGAGVIWARSPGGAASSAAASSASFSAARLAARAGPRGARRARGLIPAFRPERDSGFGDRRTIACCWGTGPPYLAVLEGAWRSPGLLNDSDLGAGRAGASSSFEVAADPTRVEHALSPPALTRWARCCDSKAGCGSTAERA